MSARLLAAIKLNGYIFTGPEQRHAVIPAGEFFRRILGTRSAVLRPRITMVPLRRFRLGSGNRKGKRK